MPANVAITRGEDRAENITQALTLIEQDVHLGDRIVVKPNMVSITRQLASTHADALDAVLHFIRDRTDRPITVAATIMGFDPHDIGYLHYAIEAGLGEGNVADMHILGERLEDCIRPFAPHPTGQRQMAWRDLRVDQLPATAAAV